MGIRRNSEVLADFGLADLADLQTFSEVSNFNIILMAWRR